ncbi:MAG: chromate efflux transporter [Rhizobiaceae bacterium]|nr:chromate efflux transporter [Rhizobiaceae bacterium]
MRCGNWGPMGATGEIFLTFLKLGLTAFGGPIAHLGYFRDEIVVRRKWIDEKGYADLVALCQFLPGPTSSQVGFAIGLLRGGASGAASAFVAFTLPSALLMVAFAYGLTMFDGHVGQELISGLKVVAVAIVAQAVWGMARALCPDKERVTIALVAAAIVLGLGSALGQIVAIAAGAVAGLIFCRSSVGKSVAGHLNFEVPRYIGAICFSLFTALLVGLPLAATITDSQGVAVLASFYHAGSWVFGGGHVVLPLLEAEVVQPGWVTTDQFLAGYGAAQAIPGPLFTFAAYLGSILEPGPNGILGAVLALVAIFFPGFLLLIGAISFWDSLRTRSGAQELISGASASVVGILGAALYNPIFTSAIVGPSTFALALICFVLLMGFRAPAWIVVVFSLAGSLVISAI